MRTALGVIVGLALFFPGIVFLQWLSSALGLYDDMTLTDGCLVMIIILLAILLVRGGHGDDSPAGQREARLGGASSREAQARRPRGRTEP